jgi:hypothetical protein
MKKLNKIKLIDMIASELQEQMTFSEIDSYFEAYSIPTDHEPSYNSKKVYVKEVLPRIDDAIILEIADELKLKHSYGEHKILEFKQQKESNLWIAGYFRLFMSHLASFKVTISQIKLRFSFPYLRRKRTEYYGKCPSGTNRLKKQYVPRDGELNPKRLKSPERTKNGHE